MQEVTLKLFMKQMANGETEESIYTYEGKGVKKESGYFISYKEEVEGVGEVSTILKMEEQTVALIRQGKLQSKQEFQKGKSNESAYTSPYGTMRMETYTRKLTINRTEGRPDSLAISYQLWLQEQYVGEFELRLELDWHD